MHPYRSKNLLPPSLFIPCLIPVQHNVHTFSKLTPTIEFVVRSCVVPYPYIAAIVLITSVQILILPPAIQLKTALSTRYLQEYSSCILYLLYCQIEGVFKKLKRGNTLAFPNDSVSRKFQFRIFSSNNVSWS